MKIVLREEYTFQMWDSCPIFVLREKQTTWCVALNGVNAWFH